MNEEVTIGYLYGLVLEYHYNYVQANQAGLDFIQEGRLNKGQASLIIAQAMEITGKQVSEILLDLWGIGC